MRTYVPAKICAAGDDLIKFEGQKSFDQNSIKTALVAHNHMPGPFTPDFAAAVSSKLIAAKPGEAGQ